VTDTSAVPSLEQLLSSVAEISQPKKGLIAAARLMLKRLDRHVDPRLRRTPAYPLDRPYNKSSQWQVARVEWYIDCIR
jgi:hypothetical protein